MRSLFVATAVAVVLMAGAQAADVKEKAEVCKGCHGDNSISQMENIPSLAGQLDQYIQWQLVYFRSGARKNEQMQPIVQDLSNEDIRNLGAYFAAMEPFKGTPDDNPDLSAKGKQAAAGRRCASACLKTISPLRPSGTGLASRTWSAQPPAMPPRSSSCSASSQPVPSSQQTAGAHRLPVRTVRASQIDS